MNVSPLPALFVLRLRLTFLAILVAGLGCALGSSQASAQAGMPTGANYTDDMPSVDKVKTVIQGSSPADTAARQVAVFDELVSYIDRVHTNRDMRGPMTPGESKLYNDYRTASYQITQDFTKSHTADQTKAFTQLEGKYSFDDTFMNAWPKQLMGQQANAALQGANAGLQASAQRMYNQQMQDYQQAQAQTTNAQGLSNDPTAVAARRCLELGGDNLACVGKSFLGGLMDMVTGPGGLDALTGPGRAGVVLSGAYGGNQSGTHVEFGGDSGTLVSCGRLADDGYSYTLSKTATTLKITLATKPNPLTLTMRADGSLLGPGAVTIIGRVVTGYEVITHYKNGVATGQDRVPQYAPATDRCALGALAAPPPPTPQNNSGSDQMGGLLGGLMNSVASVVSVSLPGLRMQGKYSSSGLLLDFAGDAVTLDCGQAHVRSPYTVENATAALIVHVQNSGGPFDLVVSSSNALRGSGSTTVNGRLVSGMNGDNVTFVPHSETCAVASFTPQTGAGATTTVAANASPAPTAAAGPAIAMKPAAIPSAAPAAIADGARASFRLLIGTSFSGANPLANQSIFIMKKPIDQALRELGVSVPASATAAQAMEALKALCRTPAGCSPAMSGLGSYYVSTAKLDGSGNATLTATAATGTYYVYAIVPQGTAALMWDVPAKVQAGDNTVTLTTTNAEQVP